MGKDRSLEGSGFRRSGRPRSKADIEAEREQLDLLHEEICQALAERHKDPAEWEELKFGEHEMLDVLRQMGYAEDPRAIEMFSRAAEQVRHAMGQVAEFKTPVLMEHYRPGIEEPLCYTINRFTERKIRECIGASEGCDFTTEDDVRIILHKADIGGLAFRDVDLPEEAFTPTRQDSPKMPWEQS